MSLKVAIDEEALERIIDSYLELGKKRRIAGEKCRSQKPLVYIVR